MKNFILAVFLFGSVFSTIYASDEIKKEKTAAEFDFRKTKWGMSRKEVKKSEKINLNSEHGNILGYQGILSGLDVTIYYIFSGDKLVRAKYYFNETHSNDNDYLSDFEELHELLQKKYGKSETSYIWKNNLFKGDSDRMGIAISNGHLLCYSMWETDITDIILSISGDNNSIQTEIEYSSKQYGKLESQEKEKMALDAI